MAIPAYSPRYEATRDNTIGAVYGWMAAGLCLTALVSMAVVSSPALFGALFANRAVLFGLFIAELGLVVAISGFAIRMGAATAAPLFLLYSALNGVTLSG